MTMDTVSVVVPVYNGAETLDELASRVSAALEDITERFEIIFVNDGSRDESWEAIAKLAARDKRIRGIDLARNFGQHNATLAGIRAAALDVIVTIDDDLQHPPEEMPALLAKLAEGYDVVYGTPHRYKQPWSRVVASKITRMALRQVIPAGMAPHVTAFRAFRAELVPSFAEHRAPYVSVDALLAWGTERFAAVPVEHVPREVGRSNYTAWKLISYAFTMVTGFSARPLRIVSILGIGFTLVGAGLLAFVVVNRIVRGAGAPGFAFLAASLAVFSGLQLFAIGTIGEYLARIYQRSLDQPAFVIRQALGGDTEVGE